MAPLVWSRDQPSTRLALVNSVWLGLSLWHGESYLIKISLYHTPRACQQFLTIRPQLLSLIGQTHNIYMTCSWNWNKLWRFTWTLTIRWPLICLDKKDSTPPRMWILLLPSVWECETWIESGQEVRQWFCKNMFASRSISAEAITPWIK